MADQIHWDDPDRPQAHGVAWRADLGLSLALAGLLVGASLSLSRLFYDSLWVLPTWLTIAAVLALAGLLRRMRAGRLLWLLAMAAGFLLYTGLVLFPETLWVLLPTGDTLTALRVAYDAALDGLQREAAPVAASREFLLLTIAGMWTVTMSAEGLAFRARQPLLAIAPALGLLVFPAMIRSGTPRWYALWFLLGVAGLLLHEGRARLAGWGRWLSHPGIRPGSRWRLPVSPANATARRLTLGVGLLALTLPWVLPGYSQPALINYQGQGPGDSTIQINPFVSLRQSLHQDSDAVLFRVEADEPAYWRLLSLDQFDGETWQSSALRSTEPFQPGRVAGDLEPGAPSQDLVQRIEIDRLSGAWLPAATTATDLAGGAAFLRSPVHRGVTIDGRWRPGFTYDVISRVPSPTSESLRRRQVVPERLRQFVELPEGIDAYIYEQAVEVAAGELTSYDRALALQDWFNSSEFTYDLQTTTLNDASDALLAFVRDERRGYCEQFAASMAVMARALRIPARVAVGFTQGALIDGRYEVTARHAHAWPELWFQGVGWIPFEPTPRADGQVIEPSWTTPAGRIPQPLTPVNPATGGQTAPAGPAQPEVNRGLLGEQGGLGALPVEQTRPWDHWALRAAAVVLVLPWLAPAAKLFRRAARRRRGAGSPRVGVQGAWASLADWAEDAGLGREPAETPTAWARRLGATHPPAGEPLAKLAAVMVRAAYAAAEPPAADAAEARRLARAARGGLAQSLSRPQRIRRLFSPRSLFGSAARRRAALRASLASSR